MTAWHVTVAAGGDRVLTDVLGDPAGPVEAEVIAGDARLDLAVLRRAAPLPETVAGLVPTDEVELLTPVVVTGVAMVDDVDRGYQHLDATGTWQGGTVRADDGVALGRLTSASLVRGMSGAPVLRLSDNAVIGVVSARYNSGDGWLRDTVWVARVEDLSDILDGLPDIGLSRRVMLAETVSTVLSVQAAGALTVSTAGAVSRPLSGIRESALEAAKVLTAFDDSCRGLGELGDLVESVVGDAVRAGGHEQGSAEDLRTRLRRRGLDPRVLFPGMPEHQEALKRWTAPLDDEPAGNTVNDALSSIRLVLIDHLSSDLFAGLSDPCRRYLREALLGAGSASPDAFLTALGGLLPPLRSVVVEAVLTSRDSPIGGTGNRRREIATIAAQMCSLPDPPQYVAGRAELAARIARAVEKRIARHGSATAFLSGQPGVGTSVVAIEAARLLSQTFPGGLLHIDLNGLVADRRRTAATVVRTISAALGLEVDSDGPDDASRFAAFAARLRERRVLLVLDNALNAAHVAPLVKAPAGCGIIVTSRDRVQSYADRGLVFRVEPLARDDSVRLLETYAEGGVHESRLLPRIAHLCADVPMALEMVGARMASRPDLSVEYLVQVLEEESTRLDYLDDGDRAVRVAIKLSYDNLDEPTRRVFRLMAAAPAAATTGAELGHCLEGRPLQQELLLNRLVDRSLADQAVVSSVTGGVLATFTLFDLVLLFARERLAEEPGDAVRDFQQRAVRYLDDRLAEIVRQEDGAELSGELDPSRFHAAVHLAAERQWWDEAIALASHLRALYDSRAELDSVVACTETLAHLHLRRGDADEAVNACLFNSGVLRRSRPADALMFARMARRIAHEHGRPVGAAAADFREAILHWEQGNRAAALVAGERAVSVLATVGQEAVAVPIAINNCQVAREAGRADKALAWGRHATELADRWAGTAARASAAFERCRAELFAKSYPAAVASARLAESLFQAEGDWWNAAVSCENGAIAAERIGDWATAVELREGAASHWERRGHVSHRLNALVELSAVYMRMEDHEAAWQTLVRAVKVRQDNTGDIDPPSLGREVLLRHAAVLLFVDDPAGSRGADLGPAVTEPDAELKLVRGVLEKFRAGIVNVAEARRRTGAVLVLSTRYPPPPASNWLHEELGEQRPGLPVLDKG